LENTFGNPPQFVRALTDGNVDLVIAETCINVVAVLMGNGDGTFQAPVAYAVGSAPISAAIGDIDGDGALDVAVSNASSPTVTVLLGNGDGTFGARSDWPVDGGCGCYGIQLVDLNQDGLPDIATCDFFARTMSVLLNTTVLQHARAWTNPSDKAQELADQLVSGIAAATLLSETSEPLAREAASDQIYSLSPRKFQGAKQRVRRD
jgi:hypothetical protein